VCVCVSCVVCVCVCVCVCVPACVVCVCRVQCVCLCVRQQVNDRIEVSRLHTFTSLPNTEIEDTDWGTYQTRATLNYTPKHIVQLTEGQDLLMLSHL
jgi:hypothetical protein